MTSLRSSLKLKKPRILIIRRVIGQSMSPTLNEGRLVIASGLLTPKQGRVVIAKHRGLEKIKRVSKIQGTKVYLTGDNSKESSDSRQFGWLPISSVIASVIWPIYTQKK